MKVKCPVCNGESESMCREPCPHCGYTGTTNVEISTADLIAELEKRRPDCNKCVHKSVLLHRNGRCNCVWFNQINDNFKEAK